jgi:imidazolonepropionase-like amidohydrolase
MEEHVEHAGEDEDTLPVEVDLAGKFLCPGLIDCHVHLNAVPGEKGLYAMKQLNQDIATLRSARMAREMIGRGFTTARDCGGASAALKEAIAEGVVDGPRLFVSLHQLTQTGGHGDPRGRHDATARRGGHVFGSGGGGRLCDGADECLRVARDQLRRGADFLKIMGGGGVSSPTDAVDAVQFTAAEVRAVAAAAEAAGTYVSCHAYTARAIRNAVDGGVRAVEHGNLVDGPTARLMAERGVFMTPTLVTYAAMASDRFAGFLPPEGVAKNEEVLRAGLRSLRTADEAGVTMCFGTDLLGPMCHLQTNEFALRSEVLGAHKIMQAATVNAAKLLMKEDFLGQIKPGFAADLLVLNANPLDDILVLDRPLEHLLVVMKDGRVHKSRWSAVALEVDPPEDMIE